MTTFAQVSLADSPQTVAEYLTETGSAPGAIVAIYDGERFAQAASGVSEIDGNAVSADQTFEIGSQTKMMTAVVVYQLVEEGLLDLDATLASYLDPSLTDGVPNVDVATVGDALAMKAGIPNFTAVERHDGSSLASFVEENPGEVFDADDVVALLNGLPGAFEPGTDYQYSNGDYLYLSLVIEAVTGQSLAEVFDERIFNPLGMDSTYLDDFRVDDAKLSSYQDVDGALVDVTDVLIDASGAGGVISKAEDMAVFLDALLVDQTLVSASALAAMTDFENGSVDEQGFVFSNGLMSVEVEGSGTFIGFSGQTWGTESATYLDVESGRIISVAVNQSDLEISADAGMVFASAVVGLDPAWGPDFEETVVVEGASASELLFSAANGTTTVSTETASMDLVGDISNYDSDYFVFSDGSKLGLGTQADDLVSAASYGHVAANANNQILGFDGNDRLIGGNGNDVISGGNGLDSLKGGSGDDVIFGDGGDDRLIGDGGNDILNGGDGKDLFLDTGGSDWLIGGKGGDRFIFRSSSTDQQDFDVIEDFNVAEDMISIGNRSIAAITTLEEGTYLTLDGDYDMILLMGIHDVSGVAIF